MQQNENKFMARGKLSMEDIRLYFTKEAMETKLNHLEELEKHLQENNIIRVGEGHNRVFQRCPGPDV